MRTQGHSLGENVVMERLKVSIFSANDTSSALIDFTDYTMA